MPTPRFEEDSHMLPKALPWIVGRFVGIAAVLLSPLAASAMEASDVSPGDGDTAAPVADAQPKPAAHATHHKHKVDAAEKKAKKRGARHKGKDAAKDEKGETARPKDKGKAPVAHAEDGPVKTERVSAKCPPKPSATPLASLAAAATKPLVEPAASSKPQILEPKEHGVEPRRTPIVRASLHTRDADAEPARHDKHAKGPCLNAPISVTRGSEEETFAFTKCDGTVAPKAIEEMSVLVRPGGAAKPAAGVAELSAKKGEPTKSDELASDVHKIDARIVERLQLVVDHFAKPSTTPKLFIVSGYRPASKGSFHALGRAIDFRMDGVSDTDLVAFCKTLPDTGCGFYPNSSFIHLDVRSAGTGRVSWIDASEPGEKPDYVASWPPAEPSPEQAAKALANLDELQPLPSRSPSRRSRRPPCRSRASSTPTTVIA
jgi:hypothetical protein